MAQATLEDPLSRDSAPSVAFIIARNGDPLTLALRSGEELDHDDLLLLNEASSSASTSVGSSPSDVFSSREPSIVTKPTSYGTDYPAHNYNGKGTVQVEYSSSLSASQGSGSESEAEQDDARRTALLGTGAWSLSRHGHDHCLRREENTKVRLSKLLPDRRKKPPVTIHQPPTNRDHALRDDKMCSTTVHPPAEAGQCPRHRMPWQHYGSICIIVSVVFVGGILVGQRSICTKPLAA